MRLFTQQGFEATTIEEIAAAAEVAPRTFFRYFSSKEEVVFWSEHQPMLAGFVAARPDHEPAAQALRRGLSDGLASFYEQDRERLLERSKLACRTPALQPRWRQQQADLGAGMAQILAHRLGVHADGLEVRAIAAAVAAALFVAIEEWQAHDGQEDLGGLIDRALGSVLAGPCRSRRPPSGGRSSVQPASTRYETRMMVTRPVLRNTL